MPTTTAAGVFGREAHPPPVTKILFSAIPRTVCMCVVGVLFVLRSVCDSVVIKK